jgi:hypothetical protein
MSRARAAWRAVLALAAVLGSCAPNEPLRRVAFRVRYGGVARDPTVPFAVHTPLGWDVTLTTARVAIGPVYLANGPADDVGTAANSGRIVAEVLERVTVDALNPGLGELAAGGAGTNEPARSAEVRFVEATEGPIADAAGAGVAIAYVAGTARRGDQVVAFAGPLAVPTGSGTSAYGRWQRLRVVHVPAELTADDGGVLTIRVDPAHWFDLVVFDAGGGLRDFGDRTATNQLLGGVGASRGVFSFTWEAAP